MGYISEDYCSEELSGMLMEKGYIGTTNTYLGKDDIKVEQITLQSAMKWLREVHKIFIDVNYDSDEFKDSPYFNLITNMNTNDYFKGHDLPQEKSTYEEACEAGIKYCLEKLI